MPFPVLVGDIGGTNARFSLVSDQHSAARLLPAVRIADYASLEEALDAILPKEPAARPRSMQLAIAAPLVGSSFRLTNGNWIISPGELIARFSLGEMTLMNDFAAQGLAALALGGEDLLPVGDVPVRESAPKVVIGPGTGLGIAFLANVAGRWAILPGEGGHIDLGPRTSREMAIWPHLRKEGGRVSAELALSGRGLENLYQAIAAANGAGSALAASQITAAALSSSNPAAEEAVNLFLTLLARVCGDMALLTLARGGVYIAGGIGQRLAGRIASGEFRREFENKAPHEAIMATMPLFVMRHPTAALEGLAAMVRRPLAYSLEGAARRFPA
jgi:glucokinase